MGKNAKIIIFSLVGLGVLGGVAALLMLTAPQPEETSKPDEFATPVSSTADAELALSDRDEQDVKSVVIDNADGAFTVVPSGNTDANGDVIWTIEGMPASAPLETGSLSTAVGYAASFEAREFAEEVSDSSELAKYGLDTPKATVKTTFGDDTGFTLMIGDDVPNTTTAVYVTPDGKKVYTAYKSRVSSYMNNEFSFVSTEATPAYDQSGSEEVMKLTVERVDLEDPIVLENILTNEEGAIEVYSYRMMSPYSAYVDLTDGPTFAYSAFGITAEKVIAVDLSEADYPLFGLDIPNCVITTETNMKTYTVTIGGAIKEEVENEDGTTTEKLTGFYGISSEHPGILYRFSRDSISALSVDPAKLISRLFLMPYIYDVDSIDYSDNTGRSIELGIKLVEESGENKDEVAEFTVNGEKCEESAFKNLYQYLISASGEELYLDEDKGELIAEITYNYIDKADGVDGKDVVRLYESNTDRKVIINLNGENLFKTRRMYATQLFSNIESFLNGGEIVLTY